MFTGTSVQEKSPGVDLTPSISTYLGKEIHIIVDFATCSEKVPKLLQLRPLIREARSDHPPRLERNNSIIADKRQVLYGRLRPSRDPYCPG